MLRFSHVGNSVLLAGVERKEFGSRHGGMQIVGRIGLKIEIIDTG